MKINPDGPVASMEFAGHLWTAVGQLGAVPWWEVFRDNESTRAGWVMAHACPLAEGEPRFLVYASDGTPLYRVKPVNDDGCLCSYRNCLLAFEINKEEPWSKVLKF